MAAKQPTTSARAAREYPLGTLIAYEITNTVTGKRYIGITRRPLAERWQGHIDQCNTRRRGSDTRLMCRAIAKYGRDSFSIRAIASAKSIDDLCLLEQALIAQEGTRAPSGYNLTAGGEGCPDPSPETRARMSAAKKGNQIFPPEHYERLAERTRGTKRAPEIGVKISTAKKGKKQSPEHLAALSAVRKGRRMSQEAKDHLSRVNAGRYLGKVHTAETRERMSEAHKGKKQSPELIAKRMAGMRAAKATREESPGHPLQVNQLPG